MIFNGDLGSGWIVVGQTRGTDCIKSTEDRIIYQSKKEEKKNDAGRADYSLLKSGGSKVLQASLTRQIRNG